MTDSYEYRLRRNIQASYARLQDRYAELEDILNQRENEIATLRDDLAQAERRIDDLEHDTWRPHR